MLAIIAQAFLRGWNIGEIAVAVVIFIAVVALVMIYCRHAEIVPPPWLVKAFWVVVGALLIIVAIRLVTSM